MSEFPTLAAMGINNVYAITRFKLCHAASEDELKIYFRPKQEGCQPASLKFGFPHQGDANKLEQALRELNRLLAETPSASDAKTAIAENMNHLELVMQAKMEEIRQRLANL